MEKIKVNDIVEFVETTKNAKIPKGTKGIVSSFFSSGNFVTVEGSIDGRNFKFAPINIKYLKKVS